MRLIPRIDVKSDYVIKSVRYEGLRNIGRPEDFAHKYYKEGATEIILIDTVASLYGREIMFDLIKNVSNKIMIPLIYSGGIRTLKDAEQAFASGADKVSLNTILFENKDLISQIAEKFGQQSVVASIDAKKKHCGSWECYTHNGRERTYIDVLDWVKEVKNLGVGEVYLSSVDYDGTELGYDVELAENVISLLNIPVVVASGASSIDNLKDLVKRVSPSGVSIGSALHYDRVKLNDICKIKW